MSDRVNTAPDESQIIVSGYACRLPGAPDPDAFWSLLMDGRSAISDIPADRWDAQRFYHPAHNVSGTAYVKRAGLLPDIWDFDAGFFGISPREAEQMDPQQRILLELAWEAVEHGNLKAEDIAGPRTGVFVGAASCDHSLLAMEDPQTIGPNFMTGNTMSILSNRISYQFDLKGPSYTVDTACSSSFYALHLAAQSLRTGEIDTAIVAGINLILSPFPFVGFSRAAMLSPDGLCKAFDAGANGYVRGEGAVVFVLRRAEAMGAHEPRRTVLAATAINSDGRTVGLSMPSQVDQTRLLQRIYGDGGIPADRVAFIEAHGTGTPIGDPIEAGALGSVIGKAANSAVPVGSAKTNVGHLEAGSGLVGLLKAQMALERGSLPASRNFETPNPSIDFNALNLSVATGAVDLSADDTPVYAGINSFGFGGSNAHAVLERINDQPLANVVSLRAKPPLVLTARSRESLAALATSWRKLAADLEGTSFNSMASIAAHARSRHPHRAVLTGPAESLAEQLGAVADAVDLPGVSYGQAPDRSGKTAFVFCGNGAQFPGMGRAFFASEPDFRKAFKRVSEAYQGVSGTSLVDLLLEESSDIDLSDGSVGQPLLFGLQIALVEALCTRGICPDLVAGHSVGEVAAAWCSGAITLEDACCLIHTRASAMRPLKATGTMAAVLKGADEVRQILADLNLEKIEIAGDNSPRSTTISGPVDLIERFRAHARSHRIAVQRIPVEYPYHSAALAPIKQKIIEGLASLTPREADVAMISTELGERINGSDLDAVYWWRNARNPVRFREAMGVLCSSGATTFVEIGPRPLLQAYMSDTARDLGRKISCVATMEIGSRAPRSIDEIAARVVAHGGDPGGAFLGPCPIAPADLPRYPWNRTTYRIENTTDHVDLLQRRPTHPLLGSEMRQGTGVWWSSLDIRNQTWLADHVVAGAAIMPAAGFVEIAFAAGLAAIGGSLDLTDFDIIAALPLPESDRVDLRTHLDPETGLVRIESRRSADDGVWTLNARGRLRQRSGSGRRMPRENLSKLSDIAADDLYRILAIGGLDYGPEFRHVTRLRCGDRRAEVDLEEPAKIEHFSLDPRLLDSALHGLAPLISAEGEAPDGQALFIPIRIGCIVLVQPGARATRADIRLTSYSPYGVGASVDLVDAGGALVATVRDLRLKRISSRQGAKRAIQWIEEKWIPVDLGIGTEPNREIDLVVLSAETLGLNITQTEDCGSVSLLLDAAHGKIAWDALSDVVDGPLSEAAGFIDGRIAKSAHPLARRILNELGSDGCLGHENDQLERPACPYPELEQIVEAVLVEAPKRGPKLHELLKLKHCLIDALRDGLEPGRSVEFGASVQAALWDAAIKVLASTLTHFSEDASCRIAVIGNPSRAAVARIKTLCTRGDLVFCRPNGVIAADAGRSGHTSAFPAISIEAMEAEVPFDVVLAVDSLGRLSDRAISTVLSGTNRIGRLLALEPAPSFALDLCRGLEPDWWKYRQDGRPIVDGRAELKERLEQSGARSVSLANVDLDEVPHFLLSAPGIHEKSSGTNSVPVLDQPNSDKQSARRYLEVDVFAPNSTGSSWCPDGEPPEHLVFRISRDSVSDLVGRFTCLVERILSSSATHASTERVWFLCQESDDGPGEETLTLARAVARVLSNERPDLKVHLVLVEAGAPAEIISDVLKSAIDEPEIRIGEKGLSVPRLTKFDPPSFCSQTEDQFSTVHLVRDDEASLSGLNWRPALRKPPGEGQIEIEVEATGLNFRDVMWGQGLLPVEAVENGYAGPTLGMECAGRVIDAGPDAKFRVGDRVIAVSPQSFAGHVTVPSELAVQLPKDMSVEVGAALPTIFMTAQYALAELSGLKAGEKLLIHGGAGGVGFAAFEIAHRIGARIFATAGTPEKREWLRLRGAEAVYDSRSLEFVDDVVADSDGGVDVVLNALAGEAMQRSLEVLRPFGRFVELGKQDLLSNTQIGLRPLRRNISYFAADLDELLLVQPHRARELFAGLANFFDDGQLLPPPVEVFDRECAIDAFRRMQASDHIGKIVVRPPKVASLPVQPRNSIGDGGWLISGGLGGLGLAAAEWLVEQGVPALWLTSRSGQPKDDDAERLAALLAKADIRVIGADVADQDRMTEVFDDIHASGHRLEGIIHGAAHFDDQTLGTLSPERIDAVLRPKAEGARVLDLLSQDHKLDHFILFSSLAARIGTPGQAAYVAANLALEQTARTRRSKGQPALAIAWGPIADFGYLNRDPRLRDQIGRQTGGGMLDLQDVRHTLGVILQGHDFGPVVTISAADWGHLARHVKMISSPVFQRLDRREPSGLADSSTLLDDLKDLSEGEARQRLICALLGEAAEILRQPECEVDPVRPMTDLGFDSLMAMDLKLSVEQSLGVSLPLVALGQETTITDLAVRLLTHIREPDAQSEETADLTDRLVTLHVEESDRSQPDKYAEAGGPENALPQLVGRG